MGEVEAESGDGGADAGAGEVKSLEEIMKEVEAK